MNPLPWEVMAKLRMSSFSQIQWACSKNGTGNPDWHVTCLMSILKDSCGFLSDMLESRTYACLIEPIDWCAKLPLQLAWVVSLEKMKCWGNGDYLLTGQQEAKGITPLIKAWVNERNKEKRVPGVTCSACCHLWWLVSPVVPGVTCSAWCHL